MSAASVDHRTWSETAVFKLSKYSKSSTRSDLSAESLPPPLEWSHFTQPGLSVVVETVHVDSESQPNHSGTRHQQIILKIIWDNNPGSERLRPAISASTDRPGVFILEKVNLTEIQERFGHSRLGGESALKAYSIDSVVGVRYATGQTANSFIFNRIQIKLQEPNDPIRLIAIIEAICPCKISSSKNQSSKSSRKSLTQLPSNPNSAAVGHPHPFSQPSIDTQTSIPDSRAFCSQPQLSQSSQSTTRHNLSQLPPTHTNLSPGVYSSSQPSPAVDATATHSQVSCSQSQLSDPSQYSRNKLSQPPTKTHLSAADHSSLSSSQPLPKVDTTVKHSQVAGSQAQFFEPSQCSRKSFFQLPTKTNLSAVGHSSPPSLELEAYSRGSCSQIELSQPLASSASSLGPSLTSRPDPHTRKSPPPAPRENSHTLLSSNYGVLPDKVEELDDLSDDALMEYVREVRMEPGFDTLVHRIRSLVQRIQTPNSLPQ
ncbi:hypothetical protein PCANC_26737 [Puccinia coronata f. sp. avenae]|uniref:Uncharacterized protein n=1 Tax=Puccinia coronata f. sp. avenae TaxID=200324 RepID=A0A2N5RX65_9BASI|nr:hypothetical protein PCANC_26737 [Puccinia coronata f. sp. avenae]